MKKAGRAGLGAQTRRNYFFCSFDGSAGAGAASAGFAFSAGGVAGVGAGAGAAIGAGAGAGADCFSQPANIATDNDARVSSFFI